MMESGNSVIGNMTKIKRMFRCYINISLTNNLYSNSSKKNFQVTEHRGVESLNLDRWLNSNNYCRFFLTFFLTFVQLTPCDRLTSFLIRLLDPFPYWKDCLNVTLLSLLIKWFYYYVHKNKPKTVVVRVKQTI